MTPNHLELKSADGTKLNLEALYQIAPSCFTEVKDEKTGELRHVVNFTTLRQLLGDDAVEDAPEMYQFTWPGKQEARREAARPITDTLRPCPEESVDWDTTQNLYIEGDNLSVLKLLQKGYMGKVKMIYIDPPYNTGNDFVYHDDFAVSQKEMDLFSGDVDEDGNRYRKNTNSNGRFHSDWCSMMYSRLLACRSLLSDDGIIFLSIDDNEVRNLTILCDEIFGNDNFIAVFPRLTTKSGKTPQTYMVSHDYILCYALRKDIFIGKTYADDSYKYSDEYEEKRGKYNLKQPLDCNSISYSKSLDYPIEYEGITYYPGGDIQKYRDRKSGKYLPKDYAWRWSKELFEFGLANGWIVFQNGRIYTKGYLNAGIEKSPGGGYEIVYREKTRKLSTIDFVNNEFSNDIAKKQVASFNIDAKFDYPKPYNLITELMSSYYGKDALVLDFFSGSATTAEAIFRINATDNGTRKFILVQLPESLEEGNTGEHNQYSTICDIAKERIRRAGKKIVEESPLTNQILDTGFRVLKLADSNFNEVYFTPKEFTQDLLSGLESNIKEGRTDLDLLFGAMLDWGIQLSLPMSKETVDGCDIYTVNEGDLVACFSENITETVVSAMAAKMPLRVLFRDSCFSEDKAKINVFELFKQKLDWGEDEAIKNIRVI